MGPTFDVNKPLGLETLLNSLLIFSLDCACTLLHPWHLPSPHHLFLAHSLPVSVYYPWAVLSTLMIVISICVGMTLKSVSGHDFSVDLYHVSKSLLHQWTWLFSRHLKTVMSQSKLLIFFSKPKTRNTNFGVCVCGWVCAVSFYSTVTYPFTWEKSRESACIPLSTPLPTLNLQVLLT